MKQGRQEGHTGGVCDGGLDRLAIAGCRRSCPGTRTVVRAWGRISPRWERNPSCGTGAGPAESGWSITPWRRLVPASRRGRPSGWYPWPWHEGTVLRWPSWKSTRLESGQRGGQRTDRCCPSTQTEATFDDVGGWEDGNTHPSDRSKWPSRQGAWHPRERLLSPSGKGHSWGRYWEGRDPALVETHPKPWAPRKFSRRTPGTKQRLPPPWPFGKE